MALNPSNSSNLKQLALKKSIFNNKLTKENVRLALETHIDIKTMYRNDYFGVSNKSV